MDSSDRNGICSVKGGAQSLHLKIWIDLLKDRVNKLVFAAPNEAIGLVRSVIVTQRVFQALLVN